MNYSTTNSSATSSVAPGVEHFLLFPAPHGGGFVAFCALLKLIPTYIPGWGGSGFTLTGALQNEGNKEHGKYILKREILSLTLKERGIHAYVACLLWQYSYIDNFFHFKRVICTGLKNEGNMYCFPLRIRSVFA